MRVKLLSKILHDDKVLPFGSTIDVEDKLGAHWIEIGAAEETNGESFDLTSPSAEDIDETLKATEQNGEQNR